MRSSRRHFGTLTHICMWPGYQRLSISTSPMLFVQFYSVFMAHKFCALCLVPCAFCRCVLSRSPASGSLFKIFKFDVSECVRAVWLGNSVPLCAQLCNRGRLQVNGRGAYG